MSLEIINYSTILMELNKAVKMHNFYPEGHPQLDSAIERCLAQIRKYLEAEGEFKWRVDQKGFYDGKATIAPGNADAAALAKKLFFRRVKEVSFNQRLTLRDLKALLTAIKSEPEEIQAKGGVEALFAEMDVSGILLNAMRYEDLRKIKDELERRREEEKNIVDEKKGEEAPSGDSAQSKEAEEKPREKEESEHLSSLIEKIREERDHIRYNDLSQRIKEKLETLLAEKKTEEVYPALLLFHSHTQSASGRTDEIKASAIERVKGLLTAEMLKLLAGKAGAKDEANRGAVQDILLHGGEEAGEVLLDAIIEAPEAVVRRNLFNALVPFGASIRPLAEARLNHGEWYAVRQMVSLLGEIGDASSLPALEAAYAHPEPRVKKEVLKGLVKIGTPRATQLLLGKLGEEDQSVVAQAIISLGMLKDPSAVNALAEVAGRREHFSDQQDAKKEAIKALGIIGDERAVPHLRRILSKKVWFGRKANEEVRALAAYSLGMIGSPEAMEALQEAYADAAGEVHTACKRILEGREKGT